MKTEDEIFLVTDDIDTVALYSMLDHDDDDDDDDFNDCERDDGGICRHSMFPFFRDHFNFLKIPCRVSTMNSSLNFLSEILICILVLLKIISIKLICMPK